MPSGEIILSKVAAPDTPAAGKIALFAFGGATPCLRTKDENGNIVIVNSPIASSVADQSGFAADTYLAGSAIAIPAGGWRAQGQYRCVWEFEKSAAGTAAMVVTLRIGTLGTTADAVLCQFTFGAGTAAADIGLFELFASFRTVGASGVVQGVLKAAHNLATTGLFNNGTNWIINTLSGSVDISAATTIGVSVNGGASLVGTARLVQARLHNGQV